MKVDGRELLFDVYTDSQYKRFNYKVLGLGDISLPSQQREAVAAVFDLTGFTNFCKQVDPHLCVPTFLDGLGPKKLQEEKVIVHRPAISSQIFRRWCFVPLG